MKIAPIQRFICSKSAQNKTGELLNKANIINIQESVSPYVREHLLPSSMEMLQNIAYQHKVPVTMAGKEGSTLVNAGAYTKLISNDLLPHEFTSNLIDFVHKSFEKMGK